MPSSRRRLPFRLLAVWLALAVLAAGQAVWLAQLVGPRHVHAEPVLEDFRRVVPGHAGAVHRHDDVRSHHHAQGVDVVRFGADVSTELLDVALAALAVLIAPGGVAEPVALWRSTTRFARADHVPASHDAEPDSPPPKRRSPPLRA